MKHFKSIICIFILVLLLSFPAYAQDNDEEPAGKPIPRQSKEKSEDILLGNRGSIALIELYKDNKYSGFGSGVILKLNIDKKQIFLLVTAAHVLKDMQESPESMKAVVAVRDKSWKQIEGEITSKSILYTDKEYDFSIIKIPDNVVIYGKDNPQVMKIQFLKKVNTGRVPTGTGCVMVGHRLMRIKGSKRRYIYVTKSGIIAGKYYVEDNQPPYYIMDSMANKGMSGGMVFIKKTGAGIGIISGYYKEPRQKILRKTENNEEFTDYYFYPSSDLTVVVAIGIVWRKLQKLIKDNPNLILNMD